ncbi:hypothetical protein SNEBB_009330 [Seison nebaliae]|nr:hypothetical protein SNEBB_009330 [Seison nebaliae]
MSFFHDSLHFHDIYPLHERRKLVVSDSELYREPGDAISLLADDLSEMMNGQQLAVYKPLIPLLSLHSPLIYRIVDESKQNHQSTNDNNLRVCYTPRRSVKSATLIEESFRLPHCILRRLAESIFEEFSLQLTYYEEMEEEFSIRLPKELNDFLENSWHSIKHSESNRIFQEVYLKLKKLKWITGTPKFRGSTIPQQQQQQQQQQQKNNIIITKPSDGNKTMNERRLSNSTKSLNPNNSVKNLHSPSAIDRKMNEDTTNKQANPPNSSILSFQLSDPISEINGWTKVSEQIDENERKVLSTLHLLRQHIDNWKKMLIEEKEKLYELRCQFFYYRQGRNRLETQNKMRTGRSLFAMSILRKEIPNGNNIVQPIRFVSCGKNVSNERTESLFRIELIDHTQMAFYKLIVPEHGSFDHMLTSAEEVAEELLNHHLLMIREPFNQSIPGIFTTLIFDSLSTTDRWDIIRTTAFSRGSNMNLRKSLTSSRNSNNVFDGLGRSIRKKYRIKKKILAFMAPNGTGVIYNNENRHSKYIFLENGYMQCDHNGAMTQFHSISLNDFSKQFEIRLSDRLKIIYTNPRYIRLVFEDGNDRSTFLLSYANVEHSRNRSEVMETSSYFDQIPDLSSFQNTISQINNLPKSFLTTKRYQLTSNISRQLFQAKPSNKSNALKSGTRTVTKTNSVKSKRSSIADNSTVETKDQSNHEKKNIYVKDLLNVKKRIKLIFEKWREHYRSILGEKRSEKDDDMLEESDLAKRDELLLKNLKNSSNMLTIDPIPEETENDLRIDNSMRKINDEIAV